MSAKHPVVWSPPWAAEKVEGSHTVFDAVSLGQKVHMRCLVCGEESERVCDTGNARHWITTFAVTHRRLHPW